MLPPSPDLPTVAVNIVRPSQPIAARIVSNELCMNGKSASFVRHIAVDVSGTSLEGKFRSGQSFGVIPPGEDENGRPHRVRLYSIASPSSGEDGEGRVISTTVKRLIVERREPQAPKAHRIYVGIASNFLCDRMPGDQIMITGPVGSRFLLPARPELHDFLFVATGTGIAPFRGMIKELLEGSHGPTNQSRINLIMGVPYTTDLLYDDLFRQLAAKHDQFEYDVVISRERQASNRSGRYAHQLIERQLDRFRDRIANPRTLLYICGLAGMQTALYRVLAAHGLADGLLTVDPQLAKVPVHQWEDGAIRRHIHPAARMFVEVY